MVTNTDMGVGVRLDGQQQRMQNLQEGVAA